MKINNTNNISFKNKYMKMAPTQEGILLGKAIKENIRNPQLDYIVKGERPLYLKAASKVLRKFAPFVEEKFMNKKYDVEDLVNLGNVAKELVCMIVYPLQVLTNPDLPKDKRRFVGLYDFFVTCFSLGGTLIYLWKGKKAAKFVVKKMLAKNLVPENIARYPKAKRALEGGAFVLGIAVQTILFKRVIAPALSPPLAAGLRKKMDANDKKNAKGTKSIDISNNKNTKVQAF